MIRTRPAAAVLHATLAASLLVVAVPPDGASALQASTAGDARPASQDARRNLIEAVVESFPRGDRQVYISPTLVFERQPSQVRGDPRHEKEQLEQARARFDARIMKPEEALECENARDPRTCTIPGNGLVVQFLHPEPKQSGRLPVKVILLYDGIGRDGGIRREMWQLHMSQQPGLGWVVQNKELIAESDGPG